MLLELTVVSYHRLSSRQEAVKTFDQFGGTIGRLDTSDWHLPDPERVVSGTHARIEKRGSSFFITDLSTNGLFVNRSVEPIGTDNLHELVDGDLLSLGEYDIEVKLVSESRDTSSSVPTQNELQSNASTKPTIDVGIPLSQFSGAAEPVSNSGGLNTDSVLSVDATSVSNTLDDDFLPPQPQMIPEEWTADLGGVGTVASEVKPANNAEPAPPPVQSNAPVKSHDVNELSAFLKGLNVSSEMIPSNASEEWWEQLGISFQELLLGLMETLRARSTVKSEFRVNQTTFQQKENNPLKFSANIDDAFHNLFNRKGPSFLPADQAIKDAFNDINRHEEAIMAGARGSVHGVLKQLSPELIQTQNYSSGLLDKMSPSRKQARYWETYVELYQDVKQDVSQDSKKAVNDEFTAAYEASLKGA